MTTSPARRAASASAQRLVRPAPPVDRDARPTPGPPSPTSGRVEQLALGQEAHRPAEPAGHHGQRRHVEVAAVVGGQQDRPPRRDVLEAVQVEAGVGEGLGADERPEQVVGLEADQRGDTRAGGPSARPATGGPRPLPSGCGSGLTACGWPTLESSGMSKKLSEQAWQPARSMPSVPGPPPDRLELAQPPDEPALEAPGVAAVDHLVAGGHDVVEAEGLGEGPDHVDSGWWWTGPAGGRPGGSRPGRPGANGATSAARSGMARSPARTTASCLQPRAARAAARARRHGQDVLAEPVVEGVEEAVAGKPVRPLPTTPSATSAPWRAWPAGPTQQRPVEIDEDGAHRAEVTAGDGPAAPPKLPPERGEGTAGGGGDPFTPTRQGTEGGIPVSSRSASIVVAARVICQAVL